MKIIIKKSNYNENADFIVSCEQALQNMYLEKFYTKSSVSDTKKMLEKYAPEVSYLIAFIDNRPIGLLQYSLSKNYHKLQINSLFTLKQYRGKGVGSKMLAEAEKIAKQKKCKFIRLHVEKLNPKGLKFYQSNNFKITGYKMEKPLS